MNALQRVLSTLRAVPDLVLALTYFSAWTAPHALGLDRFPGLLTLLVMELFVLQVAPALHALGLRKEDGSPVIPWPAAGAILLVLVIVTATFSLVFGGNLWPFVGFWVLTGNRLLDYRFSGAPGMTPRAAFLWAGSVVFFLSVTLLSVVLPAVPRLGIPPTLAGYPAISGLSGPWLDEPQRMCLSGVLYFGGMGLWGTASSILGVRGGGRP